MSKVTSAKVFVLTIGVYDMEQTTTAHSSRLNADTYHASLIRKKYPDHSGPNDQALIKRFYEQSWEKGAWFTLYDLEIDPK